MKYFTSYGTIAFIPSALAFALGTKLMLTLESRYTPIMSGGVLFLRTLPNRQNKQGVTINKYI